MGLWSWLFEKHEERVPKTPERRLRDPSEKPNAPSSSRAGRAGLEGIEQALESVSAVDVASWAKKRAEPYGPYRPGSTTCEREFTNPDEVAGFLLDSIKETPERDRLSFRREPDKVVVEVHSNFSERLLYRYLVFRTAGGGYYCYMSWQF